MSDGDDLLRARVAALARATNPYEHFFAGKEFHRDYIGARAITWAKMLNHVRSSVVNVLEIGSEEGRSAIFWLEFFSNAQLTCVDLFREEYEARFDRNIASYGTRVRKIVGTSTKALGILREEKARFDLVYVDGSHERDDVMIDCLGAWRLLREGGAMLIDDYNWLPGAPSSARVAPAVDVFLAWHADAQVTLKGEQVMLQKHSATSFGATQKPVEPP